MTERILPQSPEIEKHVLASMMESDTALDTAVELLEAKDFLSPQNAAAFQACASTSARGIVVDLPTVCEDLRGSTAFRDDGEMMITLSEIAEVGTSPVIEHWCYSLIEKSRLREIISTCDSVSRSCYDPQVKSMELIDKAEGTLFNLGQRANRTQNKSARLGTIVNSALDDIERAAKTGTSIGMPTGFEQLDAMTSGLYPGDVTVIAGRPGMGKTAFALSVGFNMARRGLPVAFFSLEMQKSQIGQRSISYESSVEMRLMRSGKMSETKLNDARRVKGRFDGLPFEVDDRPGLNVMQIRSKCRQIKSKMGLSVVFIDYLQLMGSVGREHSRERELSKITSALKELAKDLDAHVIELAQLSREVEKRGGDKRPQMSDLRESGAIEQDADNIVFLFREHFYDKEKTELEKVAELIVGKQRNGPVGLVKVAFEPRYMRFANLSKQDREDAQQTSAFTERDGREIDPADWQD